MKKVNYLLPLLVVPFLLACGCNGGSKDERLKFFISDKYKTQVIGEVAQVFVEWEPTEHKVRFLTCSYTCPGEEKVKADLINPETEPRPMQINLTFEDPIVENKNGTLSFTYKDITDKKEDTCELKFTISAPEPVDPTVTKEEFDNAIANKDETHCQTEFRRIDYENDETTTTIAQCSPGKSYEDMTSSIQGNMKIYAYALDDGTNCMMTQNINDSGWNEEQKVPIANLIEANLYVTNESYSVQRMVNYATLVDTISYDDFEYENEAYTHEYKVEKEDAFQCSKITICFVDKKVSSYEIIVEDEDKVTSERTKITEGYFTCTYNKIDVVDPRE